MYTFRKLCSEVIKDEETTMYWLQQRGLLLSTARNVPECRIVSRKGIFSWRCPRKGCQAVSSIRDESFHAGSHIKVDEILAITYWWSRGVPVSVAMHEAGHSPNIIVDWYNFHRDVCAQYFIDHSIMIGGPGKVVEIDESKFGKRKYNKGRYVEGHWVFGGIERDSKDAFMVEVPNRTAATLLPIIQRYVRPGSIVMSDEWKAYCMISSSLNMSHQTVNHSIQFVDPNTGCPHSRN